VQGRELGSLRYGAFGRAEIIPGWLTLRPVFPGDATLVGGVDPMHMMVRAVQPLSGELVWRVAVDIVVHCVMKLL
jgi:hypothetical protein